MNSKSKVVCLIPTYNEEKNIENTIKLLKKVKEINKITVIDDGSIDNTAKIVSKLGVNLIKLNKNKGKGYALKTGMLEEDFDYLVLVDGDLKCTINELKKLLYPVLNNQADVTIAKFPKPKSKGGIGLVKSLAKIGVYIFTKKKLDASLSGQRVYKREVIDKISYIPNNFGIDVAMTINTLRCGFNIKEIPVNMKHRETKRNIKGFLHRGKQFIDILNTLVKLSFRR
ncbi:glycosyltransferase family 2 protein [Caldisalinibacter kiritimatiensis]|uniref:Putative glycosyltransferase n=1 Tax=Caldisalinibacter kiritimatiensis TaxID=1304284 RepID=R1CDW2_9FIRM|nr:glycosyltransferase family 2 protein [Caldisalinibacter kiritimatiensis]EOD00465.1 putative glycosyltransferase [Caldisalinibacter kiritimatiensis]